MPVRYLEELDAQFYAITGHARPDLAGAEQPPAAEKKQPAPAAAAAPSDKKSSSVGGKKLSSAASAAAERKSPADADELESKSKKGD